MVSILSQFYLDRYQKNKQNQVVKYFVDGNFSKKKQVTDVSLKDNSSPKDEISEQTKKAVIRQLTFYPYGKEFCQKMEDNNEFLKHSINKRLKAVFAGIIVNLVFTLILAIFFLFLDWVIGSFDFKSNLMLLIQCSLVIIGWLLWIALFTPLTQWLDFFNNNQKDKLVELNKELRFYAEFADDEEAIKEINKTVKLFNLMDKPDPYIGFHRLQLLKLGTNRTIAIGTASLDIFLVAKFVFPYLMDFSVIIMDVIY